MEESAGATRDDQGGANAALRMIGGAAAAPLLGLSKNIGALTGDIRTIAESVRDIPALLVALEGIRGAVESLDGEVKLMRQGVLDIATEVEGLPETIADLERTLHPLGRLTGKFRRPNGDEDAQA